MRPEVTLVLEEHAKRLAERIVPQLTGFDANSVAMISFMLQMTAEEFERAAARRVEENQAIRAILREAAAVVTDPALVARLGALAQSKDEDLRITPLEAANNALRGALSDLHAHVEMRSDGAARKINETIWSELRLSVERRRVALANF